MVQRGFQKQKEPEILRIRQSLEAAPPTPGPDERKEEEEYLWRNEPQENFALKVTRYSFGFSVTQGSLPLLNGM